MSTREWLDDGHARGDLRTELASGRLIRLRRGFVMEAGEHQPATLHLKKMIAARRVLCASTLFSHTSAAILHGLPVMNRRLAQLTVVRAGGGHGGVSVALHARSADLSPDDATEVNGVPVTSLARTVADLVRTLPFSGGGDGGGCCSTEGS